MQLVNNTKQNNTAQLQLPSSDLTADMKFFSTLGFRLDKIYPADDPSVAEMSGHGLHICFNKKNYSAPALIHILTDGKEKINTELIAPNGTVIKFIKKSNELITPPTQHKFEVRRLQDGEPWIIGRAGMLYRDLIPDRLGGSIIASHIRIPNGGPVPDMVHYHTIGFQLIFCYSGWVKLVYEDQGPPFILHAGNCVTQPPEIRHQVLESSDNLQVIEIGVPADHVTTIDHNMELPTPHFRPEREFQGQRFCHHELKNAVWKKWEMDGFEYRDTGIFKSTNGVADVQVVKAGSTSNSTSKTTSNSNSTSKTISHAADIYFTFLMQGEMELHAEGHEKQFLKKGDAYVVPPDLGFCFSNWSEDLELLVVAVGEISL